MTHRHVLLFVFAAALGCRSQRAAHPPATARIGPTAPASPLTIAASDQEDARIAPFELEMGGGTGLCARIRDRVHCAAPLKERPWTRIGALPSPEGLTADVISISAASSIFGCAVTRDGRVHCWGDNTNGQLGAGLPEWFYEKPVVVPDLFGARRVVASERHACAIMADQTVRCWGDNRQGQCGGPVAYADEARELVAPVPIPRVTRVTALALSESSTCALSTQGSIHCWGEPLHIPKDDPAHKNSEVPAEIPTLAGLENIIAGSGTLCGVRRSDGAAICWGWSHFRDLHGQIHAPRAVRLPGPAKRIAMGSAHACALLVDGRVACWGSNWSRALGTSDIHISTSTTDMALLVEPLPPVIDVFAGSGATCALTRTRDLLCWGMWPSESSDVYVWPPVSVRVE